MEVFAMEVFAMGSGRTGEPEKTIGARWRLLQ